MTSESVCYNVVKQNSCHSDHMQIHGQNGVYSYGHGCSSLQNRGLFRVASFQHRRCWHKLCVCFLCHVAPKSTALLLPHPDHRVQMCDCIINESAAHNVTRTLTNAFRLQFAYALLWLERWLQTGCARHRVRRGVSQKDGRSQCRYESLFGSVMMCRLMY